MIFSMEEKQMNVNDYLAKTYKERRVYTFDGRTHIDIEVRPRVVCADGYSVSIQASENHYCSPRVTFYPLRCWNHYDEVELGYPNMVEEELLEYADGEDPLDSVYGFVPVTLVDKILEKHGGIVN
jgi:hypothetical protein